MSSPCALIADDEALLAADLAQRIAGLWPELEILPPVHDGLSALARLEAQKPELAFLDIRMPGLSGLDVAARLDFPCRIVFVTAYDQYAVEAFERAAVDYLLKPVSGERLALCIERLRRSLASDDDDAPPRLRAAIEELLGKVRADRPAPLKWIRASVGDTVRLVPIDDVCYFEAADKYTRVVTVQGELLIRTPIRELAEQLDADRFWQVHRGTIVHLRFVSAARHDENGRVRLSLEGRPEQIAVSRAYAYLFRQM